MAQKIGFFVDGKKQFSQKFGTGLLIACFLLIPLAPDHLDLSQLWRDPQLTPSQRRAITIGLGRLAQRHDLCVLRPDPIF